ncbi:MAG: ABC transporter permease [Chthoniobacter sp.]
MQAPFSLFLALRYLRPKRTFVSVITVISVLGVTLGVMVLIVVISVMTGFERTLQRAILGFEPHLRVTNGEIMRNWREVLPQVKGVPGVVGVAPYVQGPVLVEHEGRVNPAIIRGIDVVEEQKLIDLKKFVIGTLDMPSDYGDRRQGAGRRARRGISEMKLRSTLRAISRACSMRSGARATTRALKSARSPT